MQEKRKFHRIYIIRVHLKWREQNFRKTFYFILEGDCHMPTEKKTTHKAKENDAEKKVAPTEAVTVKDEAPSTANVKPADSAAPKAEEAPKPAPRKRGRPRKSDAEKAQLSHIKYQRRNCHRMQKYLKIQDKMHHKHESCLPGKGSPSPALRHGPKSQTAADRINYHKQDKYILAQLCNNIRHNHYFYSI